MKPLNKLKNQMMLDLDIQRIISDPELPDDKQIELWTKAALAAGEREDNTQLAIRIVDINEGKKLNEQWRHKEGPTNVLSFSMDGLDLIAPELLGDIVICAPVVAREAEEQSKPLHSHWAHMVTHGVLHLLGYDHIIETEAKKMESLEIKIMNQLGFSDPYQPE